MGTSAKILYELNNNVLIAVINVLSILKNNEWISGQFWKIQQGRGEQGEERRGRLKVGWASVWSVPSRKWQVLFVSIGTIIINKRCTSIHVV